MSRGKHHLEFDDELDVTPLIDVAFLLQIFFMVSATIAMAASIVMPKAKNIRAPDLTLAINLTIFAAEDGPEVYLSDGQRENDPSSDVDRRAPASMLEVTTYVQQQIGSGKRLVVIKADQDVAAGFVEEVARAAGEVEGIEQFYYGVMDATSDED